MNQIRVPNRLEAIKKTSSDLIGSFNIKKDSKSIRELFLLFLSHLEINHFSYRGANNDKPLLQ